jgi:hypothetical protein
MSMQILEENVVDGRAVPNAKRAGGGAAMRKPRRALGDITNGGAFQSKVGGKGRQGALGAQKPTGQRPKEPAGKIDAAPAIDVLAQPTPAPAPAEEVPDVEYANLAQDSDEIDWLKESVGLDMDQLMDNLAGGAAPVKSRGILKAGLPALESTDLGEDCLDATELLGDLASDFLAPNQGGDSSFQITLGDFDFD